MSLTITRINTSHKSVHISTDSMIEHPVWISFDNGEEYSFYLRVKYETPGYWLVESDTGSCHELRHAKLNILQRQLTTLQQDPGYWYRGKLNEYPGLVDALMSVEFLCDVSDEIYIGQQFNFCLGFSKNPFHDNDLIAAFEWRSGHYQLPYGVRTVSSDSTKPRS